ncbi:hypothetical protein SUDANB23_05891 [Streptomyces sp. enrichment culture]
MNEHEHVDLWGSVEALYGWLDANRVGDGPDEVLLPVGRVGVVCGWSRSSPRPRGGRP